MPLEQILKELNNEGYTKLDPDDKETLLNYIRRLESLVEKLYGRFGGISK